MAFRALKALIARQMGRSHEDIYNITIDSQEAINMLWGVFYATGDGLPVKRIISVLHLESDGQGEEKDIGRRANVTLWSNMRQHVRVLEICKKELAAATGATKEILEKTFKSSVWKVE